VKAKATLARRIGIGLLAVAATLLTASCAAGQHAASAQETPAIDGVTGHLGSMQLHAVAIVSPDTACVLPGGDAALTFVLVNTGKSADALSAVSSPRFASSVAVATADDLAEYAKADAGTGSCGNTAAPTATSTPSADASLPAAAGEQTVPPHQSLPLGVYDAGTNAPGVPTEPIVLLRGLKGGPLYPGSSIPVTFSFNSAGSVTLQVPVQVSVVPNNSIVPSVTEKATEAVN
jgi:copper(I)-binding protein